jgi:pimeloyl-ACP methyl ester carboxylesterase
MTIRKRAWSVAIIALLFVFLTGCAHHPAQPGSDLDQPPKCGYACEVNGWQLVETRPEMVKYRVLLLPGLLCTDLTYAAILNDPKLARAGVQLVAGNPPGFKGVPAKQGFDYTIESYAREIESLSAKESFDLIAGHSFSGNVLIEVAAQDRYPGKIMLLSPSLFRGAEEFDMRSMSHLVHIPAVGTFSMWASYRMMGSFYRKHMNEENYGWVDSLVAEGQKTPIRVATRQVACFFDNIDQYGDLTGRLISSHNRVWYVRGELDGVILSDEDRARLGKSANVMVRDIPGGRHFIMIDKPSELSSLILEILSGSGAQSSGAPQQRAQDQAAGN